MGTGADIATAFNAGAGGLSMTNILMLSIFFLMVTLFLMASLQTLRLQYREHRNIGFTLIRVFKIFVGICCVIAVFAMLTMT